VLAHDLLAHGVKHGGLARAALADHGHHAAADGGLPGGLMDVADFTAGEHIGVLQDFAMERVSQVQLELLHCGRGQDGLRD